MASIFVETYYKLIKAGRRTLDSVPENIREDVQALLDADVQSE